MNLGRRDDRRPGSPDRTSGHGPAPGRAAHRHRHLSASATVARRLVSLQADGVHGRGRPRLESVTRNKSIQPAPKEKPANGV
jgi:hypothetical protein